MRRVLPGASWILAAAAAVGHQAPAAAQPSQPPGLSPSRGLEAAAFRPGRVLGEDPQRVSEIQVELACLGDPATCPFYPCARVEDGSLEVGGYVPDEATRARTLQIARQASRLKLVDRLKVQPGLSAPRSQVPADQLSAAAHGMLQSAFPQHAGHLRLACLPNGQVIVSGVLPSHEQTLSVCQRLRSLPGCTCITNRILVGSPTAVAQAPPTATTPPPPSSPPVAEGKAKALMPDSSKWTTVPVQPVYSRQEAHPATLVEKGPTVSPWSGAGVTPAAYTEAKPGVVQKVQYESPAPLPGTSEGVKVDTAVVPAAPSLPAGDRTPVRGWTTIPVPQPGKTGPDDTGWTTIPVPQPVKNDGDKAGWTAVPQPAQPTWPRPTGGAGPVATSSVPAARGTGSSPYFGGSAQVPTPGPVSTRPDLAPQTTASASPYPRPGPVAPAQTRPVPQAQVGTRLDLVEDGPGSGVRQASLVIDPSVPRPMPVGPKVYNPAAPATPTATTVEPAPRMVAAPAPRLVAAAPALPVVASASALGDPYFIEGSMRQAAREVEPPPAAPRANRSPAAVTQRVREVCRGATDVKVVFTGADQVTVHFRAPSKAEADHLAARLMEMPELQPYRIDLAVSLAQ